MVRIVVIIGTRSASLRCAAPPRAAYWTAAAAAHHVVAHWAQRGEIWLHERQNQKHLPGLHVYMPGNFERKYWLFNELWNFVRAADRNINDFVSDFHALYLSYENVSGEIPTEIEAFMLMAA